MAAYIQRISADARLACLVRLAESVGVSTLGDWVLVRLGRSLALPGIALPMLDDWVLVRLGGSLALPGLALPAFGNWGLIRLGGSLALPRAPSQERPPGRRPAREPGHASGLTIVEPASLFPTPPEDLTLVWPVLRMLDQPVAHRIVEHVFPRPLEFVCCSHPSVPVVR